VPFVREKCGRGRQATDDNIMRRMGFPCRINTATVTHWKFVLIIAFPLQKRTHLNVACLVPIYPDEGLSDSDKCVLCECLTLNPLTWKIWWAHNKASKWQMGFNSTFKGLIQEHAYIHFTISQRHIIYWFLYNEISA